MITLTIVFLFLLFIFFKNSQFCVINLTADSGALFPRPPLFTSHDKLHSDFLSPICTSKLAINIIKTYSFIMIHSNSL